MYTFWGITFTYIYQITYFAAVMAFSGEMEDGGKHALIGIKTKKPNENGLFLCLNHTQILDSRLKLFTLMGSNCRLDEIKGKEIFNRIEPTKINEKKVKFETHSLKGILKRFFKDLETTQHELDHVSFLYNLI